MMNKKGFVFIETIVVIVVLISSLLYLYSTFVTLSNNEKRRITYDDIANLYQTYSMKKYLVSQRLDRIASHLDSTNSSSNVNFIIPFGCGNTDIFDHYKKEGSFCEIMSQELHVSSFYLTYYDLSVLKNCDNFNSGLCSTLYNVSPELGNYLKTLGGEGADGYRLIIEYAKNEQGNSCHDEEHCIHYFSSIKVGEDL